jgi:hypothetical protein
MTLQQTVTIPADRRLVLSVPQEVPTGSVKIVFIFQGIEPETDAGLGLFPPLSQKAIEAEAALLDNKSAAVETNRMRQVVEEAHYYPESGHVRDVLKELIRRNANGLEADEYRLMVQRLPVLDAFHSSLESVQIVRAMRDEWGDPWEEAEERYRLREQAVTHG